MKCLPLFSLFFIAAFTGMAQTIETPNSILTLKSGITIPDTGSYRINGLPILKVKNTSNVLLGFNSGNAIVTGQNNVFLGSNSNGTTAAITNSVAIGTNAKVAKNNAIILGDTANTSIKVGIGTASPAYPLDVRGVVNMRVGYNSPSLKINDRDFLGLDSEGKFLVSNFKIKYDSPNEWSDKVFEKEYKLTPIEEVMDFAKKNKRLPNLPSAGEVVAQGVEINVVLSKFLEKIEELTIYSAKQNQEIQELRKRLSELEDLKAKK